MGRAFSDADSEKGRRFGPGAAAFGAQGFVARLLERQRVFLFRRALRVEVDFPGSGGGRAPGGEQEKDEHRDEYYRRAGSSGM